MQTATLEVVNKTLTYRLALCILVGFLFVCNNLKAAESLLLLSNEGPTYESVASTIISQGPAIRIDTSYPSHLAKKPEQHLSPYRLIISIGSKATEFAMQHAGSNTIIFSTFIPSRKFHKLSQKYSTRLTEKKVSLTAVFLDQPIKRQLQLAKLIQPKLKAIGLTLGPDSLEILPELEKTAKEMTFHLNHKTLTLSDNPIQQIQPIMDASDLFLVIPDPSTFNKTTAKWLLYMSLRSKVPLLAFSHNYVKAGAVAACITTPEDIGRYTAEQLHLIEGGSIPPATFSPYFKVVTNPKSARQLGLSISTPENLQERLQEGEIQ
ncbi:ABC transporter substrate-binding protein [Amphritea japonica]|uniref:ABC transporter substrate-binding protein n=1 Tax=Amphritea japonica ATCC BAA-1530 TaxID=1278309 RepID=A0A7R6P822_9GAMM|nr:ABC transporter substrate binding protein [Amphritea japonica]BBB27624.1 conserved hypothetical protein [Amphritea japonica ATCC BAA-1530]